jgi:hypothetical protein
MRSPSIFFDILSSISFIHPLPTLPLKGEEATAIPSPLEGGARVRGIILSIYNSETLDK